MALTSEDREMRMLGSLGGYNPLDQNIDQSNHLQPQDHKSHDDSIVVAAINSVRSTPKVSSGGAGRSTYRECLKNHAANVGGNVTDGCGEFMPSGEEGTLEALKCAACNCHRNFHRKDTPSDAIVVHPLHLPPPLPSHRGGNWMAPSVAGAQPVKMAGFGGGGVNVGTDSSSEEMNFHAYHHQSNVVPPPPPYMLSKKRFRTKFTVEQKDKMLAFAEKLGWRIPREDDTEVQRFCVEVGVKRQVFKVWMHNNKNSAKKELQDS